MLIRRLVLGATLSLLLAGAGSIALAQTTSASLAGRVVANDGAPVSEAVVQARSLESGRVRTEISGEDGTYRFQALEPGSWLVVARLQDGRVSESQTVRLGLQETVRLDFTVGTGLEESVTVIASTPLVDRRETGGSLRVSAGQADSLPLSGRVFTDLAKLDSAVGAAAPGVYVGERGSVMVVNGQSGRSNSFLVDGLDNNDQTSGTTLNAFYSQQVIQEFVLLTHQYAPEFGRASGGILNIVTRRGSNETQWEAFAQGTTGRWNNSGDFVDRLPDAGVSREAVQRYQVGFNTGGAFRKDRAFYFLAYEHQEADDVIPYTGVDRSGLAGGTFDAPSRDDNLFFRTDFNLGPRNTLMLRFSADDRTTSGINVIGLFTPESGFEIEERDFSLAANLTSVLSSEMVNEVRLLAATSSFDQFANSDLTGVSRPSGVFGGNNLNRQVRDERRIQLVDNLTLHRGDHTLKFGIDLSNSHTRIDTRFNPNGNFIYDFDFPFEPGDCGNLLSSDVRNAADPRNIPCPGVVGVDDDGDGLIDEPGNIDSYPVVFSYIFGQPEAVLEDTRLGLFAQDRWQAGAHWVLEYGLRYDVSTYTLPASAAVTSVVPNGGAPRDTDNVAPRFGFSWSPRDDGRLVVRGGGGVFYDKLVLGFPAVAAITSGTSIGLSFPQGLTFEVTEDYVAQNGIDATITALALDTTFLDPLILRFSTAPRLDTPYTTQFNLGVEQAFGRHGALAANVVRTQGYHLPLMKDLNPVSGLIPVGVNCDPQYLDIDGSVLPCHLADTTTGSIAAIATEGRSWYTAADVKWRWRADNGWYSVGYTWSRSEDMGFDPLKDGISLPPDSTDLSGERGRSDGDRRHRVVLAGDSGLPWMGLRASTVVQYSTGLPFNVTTGADDNLDGILSDRPDGIGRNTGADTDLALVDAYRQQEGLPAFTGRLHEPSFAQVDLRVYRPFSTSSGRGRGEVFLQIFNLLDRENVGLIEGRVSSRNFGRPISLSGPPRVIELGFKIGY